MTKKLYVGNLKWSITDGRLQELFGTVGTVLSAKVIAEPDTQRSRGFGFVEMSSDDETKKAIEVMNGRVVDGRTMIVNEARPEGLNGTDRLALDLSVQIGAFCKDSKVGDNYGFKIGLRHFIITCDQNA